MGIAKLHPAEGKGSRMKRAVNGIDLLVDGERNTNRTVILAYSSGDHSFKPRKSSGRTEEQNWAEGVEALANFSPI